MLVRTNWRYGAVLLILATVSVPRVSAQHAGDGATTALVASVADASQTGPAPAGPQARMFGVLPNYTTVEGRDRVPPVTTTQTFQMAARGSFDPYVFPFVGIVSGINQAPGQSYAQRYATALADNSIGNFMTTAIVPMAAQQDPRYFASGQGSLARRLAYAASRSVVTRSRTGAAQFNVSEIGGNALAATLSNLYYPSSERTITGTLTRWGMQVAWDTLSNEMKEVWPDVRTMLHRRR